jgi:glutamyl-tRNA reductase
VIAVVGLSHRTAPIEIRERLALPTDSLPELLKGLVAGSRVGEALVVSTCNRVEFVVAGPDGVRSNLSEAASAVVELVASRAPLVAGHLYRHVGSDAVRHLFRVASSLDSLVVGEPQILGQLKDAYDLARHAGTAGAVLNRVVPRAIKSAKRVRSETAIGAGQVSVPSVGVELARQIFGDVSRHTAALVGSGEMGETVARLLKQAGSRLIVVGRNAARVSEIASSMGGEPRGMDALDKTLVEADVVITTTSAPGFIVDQARVQGVRRARKGRSLFFIDLAVPRDVDPEVGKLDGVFLYNVDDLSNVVADTLDSRKREAERAEQIVLEEAASYDRWAEAEQVTPTIVSLREHFRSILDGEVERSLGGKLRHLAPSDRDAMRVMTESAVNKLLHPTTGRLRRLAGDSNSRAELEQLVRALHDLFDLAPPSAEGVAREVVKEALEQNSSPEASSGEDAGTAVTGSAGAGAPGDGVRRREAS